jgi:type II secretory pathway pseudopilin PulG
LAKGTSGYVLTAGANDLSWAEVPSSDPTLPSVPNWASPTNTYTASGTWSKGSLADSAFVWFYLLGGGGGGNGASGEFYNSGGSGGGAVLIHATAAILNGATYVIGAGAAGTTASSASNPTETKVTLSDGRVFSTTVTSDRKAQTIGTSGTTTNFQQTVPDPVVITIKAGVTEGGVTMTDSTAFFSDSPSGSSGGGLAHSVFGGGAGKGTSYQTTSGGAGATSTYAGTGGTGQAGPNGGSGFTNGSYPGGGGGSRNAYSSGGASVGGNGAAGNLRVYHV